MHDVIVIGAGLAGTLTALELAKTHKVILIEADKEVIPTSSTSYNECFKLHTGMHYVGDPETADHCLIKALEFGKRFPEFIKDRDKPNAPWRRGRHYIMDNSHVSAEAARELALHLRDLYTAMVADSPDAAIFGSPEDFIKIIDLNECQFAEDIPFFNQNGEQSRTKVQLGIETGESQIDISALKAHLQQLINENPNIEFVPNTRVINISENSCDLGYTVTCQDKSGCSSLSGKSVVSAAWQNNELITRGLTNYEPSESRINRVKVSIQVKLPPELSELNTCIFSSGPYASITLLGNGSAILTSERLTNIGFFLSGNSELPEVLQSRINSLTMDNPEGVEFAQGIISDCASYFSPEIRTLFLQSTLEEIHIGFVKLINIDKPYTDYAIFENDSVIHSRRFDGVEHLSLGAVMNSGMKMTYTVANAEKTARIIEADLSLLQLCDSIAKRTKELINSDVLEFFQQNIYELIYKQFKSELVELAKSVNLGKSNIDMSAQAMKQKIERLYFDSRPSCAAQALLFTKPSQSEIPLEQADQKLI